MAKGEGKVVAQNKKARHDYTIVDTIEAGMVLTGTEIKSVRAARINLKDGFAQVKNGEVWLSNVTLPLTRKAIFGTKIQTVVASSCFIKSKSKSWTKTPKGPE